MGDREFVTAVRLMSKIPEDIVKSTYQAYLRERLLDLLKELDYYQTTHSEDHCYEAVVEDSKNQNLNHSIEHQNQHFGSNSSPYLGLSHRWHFDSEEGIRQRGWVERFDQQRSELRTENHLGYWVIATKS